MPDISVIIVSYNTIDITRTALDHLFASRHEYEMEVFVIDNASRDDSADILRREYPGITLIENEKNVGFGRANNQALPYIKGKYVLLLNSDAYVESDTIAKTVQYLDKHPRCGIVGVKLLGRDGTLQPSCRFFPTPWNIFLNRTGLKRFFSRTQMVDDPAWDPEVIRDCDWVTGCYLLVRKDLIDQVGLFDPRFFLYYEEVDHCFAAKSAGWGVTYFPGTSVVHLGGESSKSEGKSLQKSRLIESLQIESELLYFRKNSGLIGAVASVILNMLADSLLMLKDILKLRSPRRIYSYMMHSFLMWKLFFLTRMGSQPTR